MKLKAYKQQVLLLASHASNPMDQINNCQRTQTTAHTPYTPSKASDSRLPCKI